MPGSFMNLFLEFKNELHSSCSMEVRILYTNHRGETAWRRIVPKRIWLGKTEWHPQEQWLLEAFDVEKQADRDFAMKEIKEWKPTPDTSLSHNPN